MVSIRKSPKVNQLFFQKHPTRTSSCAPLQEHLRIDLRWRRRALNEPLWIFQIGHNRYYKHVVIATAVITGVLAVANVESSQAQGFPCKPEGRGGKKIVQLTVSFNWILFPFHLIQFHSGLRRVRSRRTVMPRRTIVEWQFKSLVNHRTINCTIEEAGRNFSLRQFANCRREPHEYCANWGGSPYLA